MPVTILVYLFTVFLYFLSWRFFKNGKDKSAILLLVLGGLILRIIAASDPYLHEWDERYHALVAKNIMEQPFQPKLYSNPLLPYDYTNWTANHVWLHKQPLALWLIALSLKVFGTSVFAVRIPSIVLSALGIWLLYDAGKRLFNKKAAFIAAFLFSIHGLIIEMAAGRAATDHIDIVFLFFVLAGIWTGIRHAENNKWQYLFLIGMFLGCAILTKWLAGLIILPVWLVLQFDKSQWLSTIGKLVIVAAIAAAIALPWQLYIFNVFPKEAAWEQLYNSKHIYEALEGHEGGWFYYLDKLRIQYGELIYLPVLWFTWYALRKANKEYLAILVWFWLPYLFFTLAATKMPAYTLIAAPAVFVITALAFVKLIEYASNKKQLRWLYYTIAAALILLPVRYTIERTKPFENKTIPEWRLTISQIKNSSINNHETVIINCPRYIELMFATNCIAYSYRPDAATLKQLELKGYEIYGWSTLNTTALHQAQSPARQSSYKNVYP